MDLSDRELEAEVLAGMMEWTDVCGQLTDRLRVTDFTGGPARALFEELKSAYQAGTPTDAMAMTAAARRMGEAGTVVIRYIGAIQLEAGSPGSSLVRADELRELAVARALLGVGADIRDLAVGPGRSADKVAQAEKLIQELSLTRERHVLRAKEIADSVALILESDTGVPDRTVGFGVPELDSHLAGGVWPGQLLIIGARPSVGKTALACQAAVEGMRKGLVFYASLEMTGQEIGLRWAILHGGQKVLRRDPSAILDAAEFIYRQPIALLESPATIGAVTTEARRLRNEKLALVVVDHLQLLDGEERDQNRNQQLGRYVRALKVLAAELQVAVLALAQLNRDNERAERDPRPSDLRDSGELEQVADKIVLLHRLFGEEETKAIVAKNRNGALSRLQLRFVKEEMRFEGGR